MDIISRIDGKFILDVSAFTMMTPKDKYYEVSVGHIGSKYEKSIRVNLPSDVMFKSEVDALVYKGTVAGETPSPGKTAPFTEGGDKKGYTFKVNTAGYITGVKVEVGDMIICNKDTTTATSSSTNYDFIQSNLDPDSYSLKGHTHTVTVSNNTGNAGGFTPSGTISVTVSGGLTTFTGNNTPLGTISGSFSTTSSAHSHSFAGTTATLSTTYMKSHDKTETATISVTLSGHEYTPEGNVTNTFTTTDTEYKSGTISLVAHSHTFTGTTATISMTYQKSAANTSDSTATLEGSIDNHTYTPTGTLSNTVSYTTTSVTDVAHSLNAAAHTHTFSGSDTTFSTTYTPAGTISIPTITTTLSSTSFNYATGEVTVTTTTSAKQTTSKALTTYTFNAANEEITFAHGTLTYDDTTLDTVSLTTASSGNILTNVTATSSQPSFTGTEATLKPSGTPQGSIQTSGDLTVTGTISANYQKATSVTSTFYGEQATITHSHNLSVANHSHSITLTNTTVSTDYTPAGTLNTATPIINDNRVFTYEKANANAAFAGTLATLSHSSVSLDHVHNISLTTTTLSVNYTPNGTIDDKTVNVSGDINATFHGESTSYSVSGTPNIASATSTFYGDAVADHSHSFSSTTTSNTDSY